MKQLLLNHQKVPAIGIGTWNMGDDPAKLGTEIAAIKAGIQAGARVIDTAEMYGNGRSETLVGHAIKPFNRTNLYLISKVLPSNASRAAMEKSLDASLSRLQIDYLDLYLYHWRGTTPLEETIDELQRLTQTGKIRAWGVSNFDIDDMQELLQLPNGAHVAANEDLYNLGSRGIDYSLITWQQQHHIPLIAYSPVGHGDRLGASISDNEAVLTVADQHHATAYQIMLAWSIRRDQVLAIPQTSDPVHMADNVAAGDIALTEADLRLLDEAFPAPMEKEPLAVL